MKRNVMRRAAALLLGALLLCACVERDGGAPPAPSQSAAPSMQAAVPREEGEGSEDASSVPRAGNADVKEAVPESIQAQPAGGESVIWQAGTPCDVSGQAVFTIRFAGEQTLDTLMLEPVPGTAQADGLRVQIALPDGTALYMGESDSLVCRFDPVRADALLVTLTSGQAVQMQAMRFGLLQREAVADAYLPAATPVQELDAYGESFARIRRLAVITGLCWDGNGTVQVIDPNLPGLLSRLSALAEEYGFALSATLYPARSLVRDGTAGKTVASPQQRQALADALADYAAQNHLDGLDLDWETPRDGQEWRDYSAFIDALGGTLHARGMTLSAAVYPRDLQSLSVSPESLDALHLMAYDQFDASGRHSTFAAAADAVSAALSAGFAADTVMLGIPAYGRPLDGGAQWPLYKEYAGALQENESGGAYFNGVQLVRDKAAFAVCRSLQGVFLYHLTGDLPAGDALSLLRAAVPQPPVRSGS